MPGGNKPVNVARARVLRDGGKRTLREVGRLLAEEEGRGVAYNEVSIGRAITADDKARAAR